jgi:hypothetical protein
LGAALLVTGASTDVATGGHVHVSREDLNSTQAKRLIGNVWAMRSQLRMFMAAEMDDIRNTEYCRNVPSPRRFIFSEATYRPFGAYGARNSWMWFTSYGTAEFRGWNSSVLAWRMVLACYLSAGLVQAAADGLEATSRTDLLLHLDGYLPHYVQMLARQQRAYYEGGRDIADYKEIPTRVVEAAVAPLNKTWLCLVSFLETGPTRYVIEAPTRVQANARVRAIIEQDHETRGMTIASIRTAQTAN